jgi:hypothetical protein
VQRGNSLNKISAGGMITAALMGWRFLFFWEFLMHGTKKHHELTENCAADQRRKSKSSSLEQ